MENKTVFDKTNHEIDIRELIGLICVEIDDEIFSSEKPLSKEEMQNKLQVIVGRWYAMYESELFPIIDGIPFYKACKVYRLYTSDLSDGEKKKYLKELLKD